MLTRKFLSPNGIPFYQNYHYLEHKQKYKYQTITNFSHNVSYTYQINQYPNLDAYFFVFVFVLRRQQTNV